MAIRICIATSSWEKGGSIPVYFMNIAEELKGRGYSVDVFVSQAENIDDRGLNLFFWPSKRPTHLKDALFFANYCSKNHPDIIITQFSASNIMMLVGTLFKAKLRINWYQTLLGQILLDRGLITPNISMRYQMWRKRFVYHFCTHLIPVSEYASLDLQKYYAVPSSKCHVFYNSTGDTSIGQEKQLGKTKIVRCFARLDPCKGIDVLVRAWKSVINDVPEAILEIYGKGSPEDVILLEEYKDYSETIKWHSAVSPTEVKQLMETANCTVLPSRMDNCPLVIIESLSTGTPVVASKVGGIPELIRDQRDGFLVEPENPLELADQLVYLLSHPEICFKMGKNAREHFLANFEVKQVARKQADWLEEEMRQRHIL